ncbi:cell division protein ZapE [Parvibaculum sedimenti]|uniref:Cell division protein ZapE n=2 Tax=Parvibaculum sedimenti TaxID=2608632 RepID=A0A6N6VLR6_9HYPH|nr:cell division protein ZapE [Parvibaculum sedimenti]KAB7742366.1 cell division protein ZapE [Parvibaculum sedimenti]
MMKGPLIVYRQRVEHGEIAADAAQARAAERLQHLADELAHWQPGKKVGPLARLGFSKPVTPPEGIYIWGGVGRGKSMLMDLFFEHVRVRHKRRVHFHAFMLETHERIFQWRQREKAGVVKGGDPIPPVAEEVAREAALLCFDEFQVQDIADASILGRLFTQLFDLGVVVVATSNIAPDDLYAGGLNRQRFLPFIDLVKERMDVVHLDSDTDYRLDRMMGLPVYYSPLGPQSRAAMNRAFQKLADVPHGHPTTLALKGRAVEVPEAAHGVARFSFNDLCAKPLGAADYIKIAQSFHAVLVDDVPAMSPERRNEAKRFVTLVDALYEAKTKLIISAAAEPSALYPKGDGAFAFERTVSRLMEMQSADYLSLRAAD